MSQSRIQFLDEYYYLIIKLLPKKAYHHQRPQGYFIFSFIKTRAMSRHECNTTDFIKLTNFSDYCLQNPTDFEFCFPETETRMSCVAVILCVFNAVIGFFGNLLTLTAIPFAAKHKK